jgi:hypothetical protein
MFCLIACVRLGFDAVGLKAASAMASTFALYNQCSKSDHTENSPILSENQWSGYQANQDIEHPGSHGDVRSSSYHSCRSIADYSSPFKSDDCEDR